MKKTLIAVGMLAIVGVAVGVGVLRARAIGDALASAPAAEPLPFSVVEIRAGSFRACQRAEHGVNPACWHAGFAEANRAREVLASLAPVEPFDMVDHVMRIEIDLPLAGLRGALASPDLKTSAGERFVVDEELPRTGTLRVHLER